MRNLWKRLITGILLAALFLFTFFCLPSYVISLFCCLILIRILILEWPRICKNNKQFWLLTPLYPILPFILLIHLNHTNHTLLFLLIATVAGFDTGAYFTGKLFGQHKLAPTISPGKTWEGVAGGYAIATSIYTFFLISFKKAYTIPSLMVFTTGVCLFALLGDLFESWLKRKAGIKDTGSILPGHGGFLDRMDGLLIASCYVYVNHYCFFQA